MTRWAASLGSALFLVVAPGTIAGLIPWLITRWRLPDPARLWPAGAVLIALGLWILLESFARFALQGLGTPAPVAPPGRLVVTGFYRRVRNPMYVAVTAIILGQALVLASTALAAYAAVVWAAFHTFVVAYEEPTLRRTFPHDYAAYVAAVPRWRPRLRPWRPN